MTVKTLLALSGLFLSLSPAAADFLAGRDLFRNEVPDGPQELVNPNFTVPARSYGYRITAAGSSLTLLQPSHHTNALNGNPAVQGYGSNVDQTVDVAVNTGTTPVGNEKRTQLKSYESSQLYDLSCILFLPP